MQRNTATTVNDIVFSATLRGREFTFHSTWGLFSRTAVDDGTRLLVEEIAVNSGDVACDVGCGYGAIGIPIAAVAPRGTVHMVDRDIVAVEYARKNAAVNGVTNCQIYPSNGFQHVPASLRFDLVVSNLPTHVGREFLWMLLRDAETRLRVGGSIYVVTVSGIREFVKRSFVDVFGNYERVSQGKRHTIAKAVKN